jgi:hypothetical protein
VVIIQACQPVYSGLSTSQRNSIVLDRAHTLLLISTVVGGMSERGAFLGAIADQIKQADGKTSMHDMTTNAIWCMKKKGYSQDPEVRSTLQKMLILHPAVDKRDTTKCNNKSTKESLLQKLGYSTK